MALGGVQCSLHRTREQIVSVTWAIGLHYKLFLDIFLKGHLCCKIERYLPIVGEKMFEHYCKINVDSFI